MKELVLLLFRMHYSIQNALYMHSIFHFGIYKIKIFQQIFTSMSQLMYYCNHD